MFRKKKVLTTLEEAKMLPSALMKFRDDITVEVCDSWEKNNFESYKLQN